MYHKVRLAIIKACPLWFESTERTFGMWQTAHIVRVGTLCAGSLVCSVSVFSLCNPAEELQHKVRGIGGGNGDYSELVIINLQLSWPLSPAVGCCRENNTRSPEGASLIVRGERVSLTRTVWKLHSSVCYVFIPETIFLYDCPCTEPFLRFPVLIEVLRVKCSLS